MMSKSNENYERHGSGDNHHVNDSELLKLPYELLVHIFSHIDSDYLLNIVSMVCKDFHEMLMNEQYWRLRMRLMFPDKFPIVQEDNFCLIESCEECWKCLKTWKISDGLKAPMTLLKSTGYGVDCTHLTEDGNLCVCGSRDRRVSVFKLDPEPGAIRDVPAKTDLYGHEGWVWSISSSQDEICTTSFDTTVKIWDKSTLNMTRSLSVNSPPLCSTYLDDSTVTVGCNNKKILLIDTKSGNIVHNMNAHRKAVLQIAAHDNYIFSSGEDGLLLVIDKRKMSVLSQVKCQRRNYGMSMDSHGRQIWLGHRNGMISVFDIGNVHQPVKAADFNFNFKGQVTSLQYTTGAIYAGSTDGHFKIYQPTLNPECLATHHLKNAGIIDISVHGRRLVVSNGDGLVLLWDPYEAKSEDAGSQDLHGRVELLEL